MSVYLKQKHIVVLGAGYAGLPCALRLARNFKNTRGSAPVKITLINREARQELICELYRTLRTGKPELYAFAKIARRNNINFVEGIVSSVDPIKKTLQVRGEQTQVMSYDVLVVALGHKAAVPNIPGLHELNDLSAQQEQRVFQFRNNNQALALRMALKRIGWNPDQKLGRDVFSVVIGAGITGIEVAGEIAALRRRNRRARVILLDSKDDLLHGFSGIAKKFFKRELKQSAIEPILGSRIASISPTEIQLENRQVIPWDLVVLCTGTEPIPSAMPWFQNVAEPHGIPVESNLEIKTYRDHYAIGDIAIVKPRGLASAKELPRVGQLAIQQGLFVADEIYRKVNEPDRYQRGVYEPTNLGLLISLGGNSGIGRIGPEFENKFLRFVSPFVVGSAVDQLKRAAATKYKLELRTGLWPF